MGPMSRSKNRAACVAAVLAAAVLVAGGGCGYSVRPPYDPNVHTVYVPIFQSLTFRRDINLQLTEAVIKEIEKRTPYKVVGSPEGADSTLEGLISYDMKNLLVENPNNLPRQLTILLTISVKWIDNRPGVPKKDVQPTVFFESMADYPELGETTVAAYEKLVIKLARDIVNTMEEPWTVRDEKAPINFEPPPAGQ